MFGIEPTHSQELKNKQRVRLFFEEFLVDMGSVALTIGHKLCDVLDFLHYFSKEVIKYTVKNKQRTITAIVLLSLAIIMVF